MPSRLILRPGRFTLARQAAENAARLAAKRQSEEGPDERASKRQAFNTPGDSTAMTSEADRPTGFDDENDDDEDFGGVALTVN